MEQEYLGVKEFASAVGVSVQAIYKRLKKDDDILNHYVKNIDGKTTISASAINDVFNIKSYVSEQQAIEIIEQLKERIEEQKQELNNKDDLIKNLMEQIKQQNNLLDQQQKLHALDKQKLLMLEDKTNKKKGFFSWFKKKDNIEKEV